MTRRRRKKDDLSKLRQEAGRSLEECHKLLRQLLRPGRMIAGSFYEMYKKCGRANCRCAFGELHGPYPVISFARGGRRWTRSVPRNREQDVRARAEAYRQFRHRRARLRQAMKRIDEIVRSIRDAHVEDRL
jgi:hypothetical protein